MSNYLQLGHESWNLVDDPNIGPFSGVVLSPVNDAPEEVMARLVQAKKSQPNLDVILDPQLYNPATQRGQLPKWGYYGDDFETADRTDVAWWKSKVPEIVSDGTKVGATVICSPAPIDYRCSDEYLKLVVDAADETKTQATASGMDCALTAIVPLEALVDAKRGMEIASILSGSRCDRIYLNFLAPDRVTQKEPFRNQAALATAVHLIRLLSDNQRVHVACTSHDAVLWLGAGASDVSTGKFMNVRRFSPGRWDDEAQGGRNISYWSDDRLLTLIRDQEVLRLDREGWFQGRDFSENPAAKAALELLRRGQGEPWLRLSWVLYLRWFANTAAGVRNRDSAAALLDHCLESWRALEAKRILFVDSYNDGSHAVAWLNAFNEGWSR